MEGPDVRVGRGERLVEVALCLNVRLTSDDGERLLLNVPNEGACGAAGGWYYDDAEDPQMVLLCPSVCGDGVEGAIEIEFGCETVKV